MGCFLAAGPLSARPTDQDHVASQGNQATNGLNCHACFVSQGAARPDCDRLTRIALPFLVVFELIRSTQVARGLRRKGDGRHTLPLPGSVVAQGATPLAISATRATKKRITRALQAHKKEASILGPPLVVVQCRRRLFAIRISTKCDIGSILDQELS